jgi:hypothetical protein
MATVVKAEETTIIKRDSDRDREVIKEREGGDRTVIKRRRNWRFSLSRTPRRRRSSRRSATS